MMVTSGFKNNLTSQTGSILKNRLFVNSVSSGKLPSHQIHHVTRNKNEYQIITIKKASLKKQRMTTDISNKTLSKLIKAYLAILN